MNKYLVKLPGGDSREIKAHGCYYPADGSVLFWVRFEDVFGRVEFKTVESFDEYLEVHREEDSEGDS
jgi:hypothetical protein